MLTIRCQSKFVQSVDKLLLLDGLLIRRENEAVRELETEEDDEPVTDDKVSTLVLPQSQKTATEKTDTEWDDDLKKTTQ